MSQNSAWKHERLNGEVVAPDLKDDDATAARRIVEHLEREQYNGILVNVLSGKMMTNLVRYLPRRFLRVLVVHTTSIASYKAARSVRDYAPATICVSARIRRDLVAGYGFDEQRTLAVPNAIDARQYQHLEPSRGRNGSLKVIFLGRLEDASKGISFLPQIFNDLTDLDVSLTIAGDGPDRMRLQKECAQPSQKITLAGFVQPDEVPRLLAQHDILLMPSRYEGFGQSLVEGMAAGCVPVASLIRGVTDTIVRPEQDGFLFPIGDIRAAAEQIRRLAQDRATLERMSAAARQNALDRFSIEAMASHYAHVLWQACHTETIAAPLPLDRWYYPFGLRAGLRTYLPIPVKNTLRLWRERLAVA